MDDPYSTHTAVGSLKGQGGGLKSLGEWSYIAQDPVARAGRQTLRRGANQGQAATRESANAGDARGKLQLRALRVCRVENR